MTGSKFNFKKWFSMKNDTVEEAEQRYKRSLICIPVSILPTIMLALLQDVEMSSFIEYPLFAVFCVCLLSSCVALSSLIGPIKLAYRVVKRIFFKPLSGLIVLLYPITLLASLFVFVIILMAAVCAPVLLTLCGVYQSKKNLDEVKNQVQVL